ncbi:hypothetical protein OSB04_027992 [Centaurea solstitialis]|uniref:Uncharacterized protein n=1 Tax=Centaurea solstitialis TaxID=347529 RepID=A0AA38ST58_9ASTR|nr:hypothetical protein OSB04_027992 [Centaurea solstitialis]
MPNKVTNTAETGSSNTHKYCDVEEGEDEAWLNSITNDEWEMSAECLWGASAAYVPTLTPTSTSAISVAFCVVGRNHELGDSCDCKTEENQDFEGGGVYEKGRVQTRTPPICENARTLLNLYIMVNITIKN